MTLAERSMEKSINKFPWVPFFGTALGCEEDVDLEQTELEVGAFSDFKSASKPYVIYTSVDELGLFLRSLRQTPNLGIDLQQVYHHASQVYDEQERVMTPLEDAAKAGDERAFLDALQSITWQDRTPTDFMRAVRLALEAGAHLAARELATEGAERHPNDSQLQKYARLLAPPKVVPSKVRSDRRQRKANREWLKAHGDEYHGQWVAVHNGELLGASDSLEDLTKRVGDTGSILLTKAY